MKKVYWQENGYHMLNVTYYPGMVELQVIDNFKDNDIIFNVSVAQWRAMNKAVESAHGGIDP